MTTRTCLALAAILLAGVTSARAEFYYRNVNPGAQGMRNPGSGSGGTTPVDPTGPTTPTTPTDPTPPTTPPDDQTGPLRLTLTPAGDINATYQTSVNAVFHAAGGCAGGKSFSLSGASPGALADLGLSAGASGNDYVISGRINRIGVGGTYNITVTVRDSCFAAQSVQAALNLNPPPADYDPPWDLHLDGTVAYNGQPFAFYPDIRGTSSSDAVDTRGFTYTLGTLDPANRPIPAWLHLNDPSTGVVTGTAPTQNGSYGPFYLTAQAPNGGFSQSVDFTVGVNGGFTFSGLDGTGVSSVALQANESRTLTFTGTGGCSINRYFTADSDYPLPTGMQFTYSDSSWVITGAPTVGGTWPLRLAFTDYACGPSQYFPVTLTIAGAPEPALAFSNAPQASAVYVNGRDPGVVAAYVDTTGPGWKTTACSLANPDGTPANVAWATPYAGPNYICALYLRPTDDSAVGDHTWRLRATTDSRGSVLSDPVTVTVSPKSAEPPPDPED